MDQSNEARIAVLENRVDTFEGILDTIAADVRETRDAVISRKSSRKGAWAVLSIGGALILGVAEVWRDFGDWAKHFFA